LELGCPACDVNLFRPRDPRILRANSPASALPRSGNKNTPNSTQQVCSSILASAQSILPILINLSCLGTMYHCQSSRTQTTPTPGPPAPGARQAPQLFAPVDVDYMKPSDPSAASLSNLPTEIRLEIFNHVLDLSCIPLTYGYTSPFTGQRKPTLHKHALLLVSKQISSEYRQAFYERTRFFLRIYASNAFQALPMLLHFTRTQSNTPRASAPFPNFWNAPDALLANLRHCTLYIEIGEIASAPQSSHSVSQIARSSIDLNEAHQMVHEMKKYSSLNALKKNDSCFDNTLKCGIHKLLGHMTQLRSMHLVWETTRQGSRKFSNMTDANWTWATLGKPFVEALMMKRGLKRLQVVVGDRYNDVNEKHHKGVGGRWETENRVWLRGQPGRQSMHHVQFG
ncbi:uncharacterized protein BDR25DRAFT_126570, partial [Lindgomyces ingoldianus]